MTPGQKLMSLVIPNADWDYQSEETRKHWDRKASDFLKILKDADIDSLRAELQRLQPSPAPDGQPILAEAFADNGAHSHWCLIDAKTGAKLWSEDPDECAARGFAVSSPAPVGGGVPEMDNADVLEIALEVERDLDLARIKINQWFASRLPALKPGEVVVNAEEWKNLRECAKNLLDDIIDDDAGDGMNSQEITLWRIRELRAALRAQPTPTEKETDHV